MGLSIWTPLVIDRVHMTVSLDEAHHKFAYGQLHFFAEKDMQKQLVPEGQIKLIPKDYVTQLHYYPQKGRKIADITVGVTKSKHRYFTLGLYPSKFGAGEFDAFKSHTSPLLASLAYEQLFHSSKISYIELATDSLSKKAHSFIPFRRYCNTSSIFMDKQGELGTTYLGSVHSAVRTRIYDKRRQLLQTGLVPSFDTQTRFEIASRHIGIIPAHLPETLQNPFTKLQVADLALARHLSKDLAWHAFLDSCLLGGSADALSKCTKYQRKTFMSRLIASPASWWNPDFVWTGSLNAFSAIAP